MYNRILAKKIFETERKKDLDELVRDWSNCCFSNSSNKDQEILSEEEKIEREISLSMEEGLIKAIKEKTAVVYCLFLEENNKHVFNMAVESVERARELVNQNSFLSIGILFVDKIKPMQPPQAQDCFFCNGEPMVKTLPNDFKSQVMDWTDYDVAEFFLGISLGIFEPNVDFLDCKDVIWSNTPIGNLLCDIINCMVKEGVLLKEEGKIMWGLQK
ncbi:MAG TPA: hypothetical protein PLP33_30015 [Leptospiraceae bacterium]|nr:hypothetical protein [Leptospiraceae bacterium]